MWRRECFEWEREVIVGHFGEKDSWLWSGNNNGVYNSHSAYNWIISIVSPREEEEIFSLLWRIKAPRKALFFIWRLLRNRLPTKDNLCRRNIIDNDETLCSFFQQEVESAQHLFSTCYVVATIWKKM